MSAEPTPPSAREWLVRIFERGNRINPVLSHHPLKFRSEVRTGPNWFRCADGMCVSVIAGWGTYCSPRPDWPFEDGADEDYTGPFTAVEVWFPEEADPAEFVEAERLWAWVNKHGGVVDYLPPGAVPEESGWITTGEVGG